MPRVRTGPPPKMSTGLNKFRAWAGDTPKQTMYSCTPAESERWTLDHVSIERRRLITSQARFFTFHIFIIPVFQSTLCVRHESHEFGVDSLVYRARGYFKGRKQVIIMQSKKGQRRNVKQSPTRML
jgi:hypothetical protein